MYLRINTRFFFIHSMTTTAMNVFNQYYWDLLKKSKNLAKDQKHKASSDGDARTVLKEIKKSYMSFDKGSDEHLIWYKENVQAKWSEFAAERTTLESWAQWYADESLQQLELYKGITIGNLTSLYKSKDVVLYYMFLLAVFANTNVTLEHVSSILTLLRKRGDVDESEFDVVENCTEVRDYLKMLHDIVSQTSTEQSSATSSTDKLMSELENTSLGKLAKEIMDEVNVGDIQKSIGEDGDILKAFSDPNGELSKFIGTVTQKMISKLASGEIKQDTLLGDAMKLAGSLPGGAGGLGNMSGMLEQFGKMANMFGGGDTDDSLDIASMMKNMMGGSKSAGGRGTRAVVNSPALTRNVKAKQLRRKLEERRKTKENIETQVGDE